MNVQEFINYKSICPICSNDKLHLVFKSQSKKILYRDNDRFIVIFDMKSIKKGHKSYKVGYSINKINNSFQIEFYNKTGIDETYYESVPTFLLNRFKDFNKNQFEYVFYKCCLICNSYNYQTNYFKLDLKSPFINDLHISSEFFNFNHVHLNKIYSITLKNSYNTSSFNILEIGNISKDFTKFNMPLIQFTNIEEVGNRLLKLIAFS